MASDTTRYTNKVFMTGALPLLKTIANDVPELKKKFEGVNAVYQVSAMANAQDKEAIHFIIEDGEWTVKLGASGQMQAKIRSHCAAFSAPSVPSTAPDICAKLRIAASLSAARTVQPAA